MLHKMLNQVQFVYHQQYDHPHNQLNHHQLLQNLSKEYNMTVVVITHNSAISEMADRVIRVKSGKILSNVINPAPVDVDTIEW